METRDEFLSGIITSAIEGGNLNYWAKITHYDWKDRALGDDVNWAEAKIIDMTTGIKWNITHSVIEKGLTRLRQAPVKFLNEEDRAEIVKCDIMNDAGNIDAVYAEEIVQVALFGEMVYG